MSEHSQKRPRVIPAGLTRCPKCGEFRGEQAIVPSYRYDLLEIVSVTCLCDGIPCKRCSRNLIHRPLSNFFDERTGHALHVAWFGAMIPCEECRPRRGSRHTK